MLPAFSTAYRQEFAKYEEQKRLWGLSPKASRGEPPQPPPPLQHVVVSDTTVEALADRLGTNPRGLLLATDELSGWFGSFGRYQASGRGSDVAHFLNMHRAGSLKVDRKSNEQQTLCVPHAAVSITGGIQPQILARVLTREFHENGLAARFLMASPPRRKKAWTEQQITPEAERALTQVFDFLYSLSPAKDGEPVDLPLSEAAKAEWIRFYDGHAAEQETLVGTDLAAAWSKLEGAAARLALVVHAVRAAIDDVGDQPFVIDEKSVAAGVTLVEWFKHETKRVYSCLSEDGNDTNADRLAASAIWLAIRKWPSINLAAISRQVLWSKAAAPRVGV